MSRCSRKDPRLRLCSTRARVITGTTSATSGIPKIAPMADDDRAISPHSAQAMATWKVKAVRMCRVVISGRCTRAVPTPASVKTAVRAMTTSAAEATPNSAGVT
jgi:hypothetical protein